MELKVAETRLARRLRRKMRIRKKVHGTKERPRLVVTRSAKHIYAQVIDDTVGHTLCSASSLSPEIRESLKGLKKVEQAKKVGGHLASKCLQLGIKKVVFDRNGYLFHGRVKALADAAREAGLDF
jgi:large subunit ribosomal protein L18